MYTVHLGQHSVVSIQFWLRLLLSPCAHCLSFKWIQGTLLPCFCAGMKGPVLKWFQSHVLDRSLSAVSLLNYGVPQVSILGPGHFSLYILPLESNFKGTTSLSIV